MPIRTFSQLLTAAQRLGPRRVVLVAADQWEALEAASLGYRKGLGVFTLIGNAARIESLLAEGNFDLGFPEIIDEESPRQAAHLAIELARSRQVDLVMNGRTQPGHLVRRANEPATGLRTPGRLMTDVSVFEIPGIDRLILVADILVVVNPTLEDKVGIVQNAIDVALALQIEKPRVAILSATEMVNPRIPVSMDAANLAKMAQRGQIKGGIVDGPLALDNAISVEAARIKGIQSDVAGRADILITPDMEAGNILAKAISYFAGGKMASVIVGGICPIIMPSRSDPPEAKLASLALGVFLAGSDAGKD